jgi:hypothetical protein
VIAYRAKLDVPRELVQFVAKLLLAERCQRGTPRGSRALTCFSQAVLGLRWFRDRTTCEALARDHGISRATGYRYVDEVIEVLAQQAPDLRQALERSFMPSLLSTTLLRTCPPWLTKVTRARASAFTSGSNSQPTGGTSISIPVPATLFSVRFATWENAGSLCSPAAGAPSSTSPPVPAKSAISPAQPWSLPISNTATSHEFR